jgi:1-acyl-sn-glycerol-3-phosphate acyltransferase
MFFNPYAKSFLTDCGVVPVDRTTKNNAQLYAATFEVLKLGEAVAVFPEGTSHTLPKLSAFKDGTSFVSEEARRETKRGGKLIIYIYKRRL